MDNQSDSQYRMTQRTPGRFSLMVVLVCCMVVVIALAAELKRASGDGKVHLFVVATGLGGWAAARVVHLVSSDPGESFKVRRVLPMSPLFNTSVLVRTAPVELADGGGAADFELGIKYPMIMAFDNDGAPQWLARIGERTTTLQPAVIPVSSFEAHALMRDASHERRVQHAFSRDGGVSWEDLAALDLPNHGLLFSPR